MASTISTVDADSIAVVARSACPTSHTRVPYLPPFPPKKFVCSPGNHGLPRTGLKAVSEESSFLAVMDALAYRVQDLSLSESPARQATAPVGSSVDIATTPVAPTAVNTSLGRNFSNSRSKIFSKCTESVRASFKKMVLRSGKKTKKAEGASRPPSQCLPQQEPLVGQLVESGPGRSMLEAVEANQHREVSRFDAMFSFEGGSTRGVGDLAFSPPLSFDIHPSNPLPVVTTIGLAGIPMEDIQQPPTLHPTSPAPIAMEVEPGLPPSNAALLPEPRQTPFEAQMNGEVDAPVRGPSDTVMSDAEDVPCATGPIQQTESTSQTPFDLVSTTSVSSTLLDQDVDMEDAADSRSFTSLQQAPTSNGLDGPAPTLAQAATPSTTTTSSTAGPSTPTSSTSSHPTPEDVQPTATHAAHLHRVLGKWGLPKQASNPPPPAVPNEASKEAEVKSFFAMLKASRPPVQPQPKPTPSPSSSKPRQTKGEAARSLMDDLMAGFRSATKGKPSQQQVAMAVDPPAQSRPVLTTTATHVSFAVPPKLPRSTPVVAGRQPRPQPTPPHHVGTGSEATAPGGSMISPSEAPSTAGIPTIGKVNGPSSGSQVQVGFTSGAAVSGMASDTAMDGVESGRAIKGSRKAARAIARTGWTLETAQQKTREVQIAQDVEHNIEVAPPPASSLRAFEERVKSSAWHAAQPPPPPEAMAYIGVGKKIRRAA